MVMAADLSARLGQIGQADAQRLKRIIASMHLPIAPPKLGSQRFMELMQVDKKTEGGQIRYITLGSIGAARIQQVPDATVIETLIATGAAE
jgi:3-dehydroquinate synthase